MTKNLENMLNLPEDNKKQKKSTPATEQHESTFRDIAEFDKISNALPAVKGLGDMADNELNEVADKAMTAYDDLMDLGMNVEARYSGRVFEVAGTMLKTGLDAKVAKLDKKLKMVELQLKKEKQDKDSSKSPGGIQEGDGYIVSDRNSLLEQLKGIDKDK